MMTLRKALRSSVLGGAIILLAAGSASAFFTFILPPREGPVGKKHTPVVEAIAAQTEIREGAMWKIYLRASDPDGDLDKIIIIFGQLGAAVYSPDTLYQDKKTGSLNGAILVWASLHGASSTDTIYATVSIIVEDRAGNVSDPKTMEFEVRTFGPDDTYKPPPDFNASHSLGQAEFPLMTDEDLVGDSDDGGGRD